VNVSVELLASSQQRAKDHTAEASTVTVAQAVKREVIDERMRKEEAEDSTMTQKRPWWMEFFSRTAT
jgi:hypothetical protein